MGLIGTAGLRRFLASRLSGVEPFDAVTFAFVRVVMLAAALLAS